MTRVAARFHPLDAVPRPGVVPPPRRHRWLALAALLASIGLGVVLMPGHDDAADPRSVRIDIDVDGATPAGGPFASLRAALGERLTAVGFVVPEPGAEAARTLTLAVSLTEADPPLGVRLHERRADVSISVRDAERRSVDGPTVTAAAADKTRIGAEDRLGETLLEPVFDAALRALLEHPDVRADLERAAGDGRPAPAIRWVETVDGALEAARSRLAAAAAGGKAQAGRIAVSSHGPADLREHLVGAGPAGPLVVTEVATLVVPFTKTGEVRVERRPLGVELSSRAAGGVAPPIWTGSGLVGTPALGSDGRSVILVEDVFGLAQALTLAQPDGRVHRLRVDATDAFEGPRLASDGALVAVGATPCRGCPGRLLVIDAADGSIRRELQPLGGAFAGWAWQSATRLLIAYASPDGPPPVEAIFREPGPETAIYVVDLTNPSPPARPLWRAAAGERIGALRTTPDGAWLVFEIEDRGSTHLGILEVDHGTVTRLRPGHCAAPSLSNDGAWVAFELAETPDQAPTIAAARVADGEVIRLADAALRGRRPIFSAAGTRIYFEAVTDDPVAPDGPPLSRIVSVPFAPASRASPSGPP